MIKIAFYGDTITFDGISSEVFNLYLYTPDANEKTTVIDLKSNITKSYKQSKYLPKKRYTDNPNYLSISLMSENILTRNQIDKIEEWLHTTDDEFKKLTINQDDMFGLYYNCRLQKMEFETFGNKIHMIHLIFETDSIYAWENPSTLIYTDFTNPITFNNTSSEDLMCPIFQIKMGENGGTIKIEDTTNADIYLKSMELINLQANEIITINSETCVLTSNLRTNILKDFLYINFMRFTKGNHNLIITGDVEELKITYQNARKIGI